MAEGTKIWGHQVLTGGMVFNDSNATILCLLQGDKDTVIYQLAAGRQSPSDRDVDAVKAIFPATIEGLPKWFKFPDSATATVWGMTPSLRIGIRNDLWSTKKLTDAELLTEFGLTGTIEQYMKSDQGWGTPIRGYRAPEEEQSH